MGRAIRSLVRFEFGERVEDAWEEAVTDMLGRVGQSVPGQSFGPPDSRGGFAERAAAAKRPQAEGLESADQAIDLLSEGTPGGEDELLMLGDDAGPLSILIIDSGSAG